MAPGDTPIISFLKKSASGKIDTGIAPMSLCGKCIRQRNCCVRVRTPKKLSLRASALKWRGNPPVERNQVTIATKNRGESQSSWKFSEHFRSNRGIATTSVRTGLAMTGYLEQSAKQQFTLAHSLAPGRRTGLRSVVTIFKNVNFFCFPGFPFVSLLKPGFFSGIISWSVCILNGLQAGSFRTKREEMIT